MAATAKTTIKCPGCGKRADVTLDWTQKDQATHATVSAYECPSGCQIDEQTVREIIGAQ